jgi:O-antigen/teichoic acid export membrane protein
MGTYFLFNNFSKFTTLAVTLLQVTYNTSLDVIIVTNAALHFLIIVIEIKLLKKNHPGFKLRLRPQKEMIQEVFSFGFLNWLQSAVVIFVFQLDRYIAVTSTIFVTFHTLITAAGTWLIPKIVNHSNHVQESRELYITLRAFITVSGITSLLLFYTVHKPLFILWIGAEKFQMISEFIPYFTMFELFYLLFIAPPLFLNFTGRQKQAAYHIIVLCVLNAAGIITGFMLQPTVTGMLTGLTVSVIPACIIIYSNIKRAITRGSFFSDVFFFVILSLTACLIVLINNNWLRVILTVFLFAISLYVFIKLQRINLRKLFN